MHSCNYKPFHFLWTLQHKCNSPLGPTSFFFFLFSFFSPLMFWKGMGPKIRITDKESRFVPCQLKISCRERMQRRIGRGLIEAEHSQVRAWSEAGWETRTFHTQTHTSTLSNTNHHNTDYTHSTSVIALPADCCWWLWCWTRSISDLQPTCLCVILLWKERKIQTEHKLLLK